MVLTSKLRRPSALAVAGLLLVASLLPLLSTQKTGAYGLLTNREIRLSSSASGSTSAGQDVTYLLRATTPANSTIGSIAIEFCSDSPIIGDTCTAPVGFSTNEAGLAIPAASQTGITDWTITPHASTTTNVVVLTRTGGPANFNAGTFTLELGSSGGSDGITNPTASNTTFYARILTYTDEDDDGDGCSGVDDSATCYATATIHNNSLDAGGVALSTANQITVTSKVQERLTFCVYTSAANYTDCTGVTGTAVTLGDDNGVLSDAGSFVDKTAKYNVSTNASSGVLIRAKGSTLTSGSFTIDPAGGTTPGDGTTETAGAASHGTEQFGFCTYRDTGGGVAGLTAEAPYNDAECAASTDTSGDASPGTATNLDIAFDLNDAVGTDCGTTASAADFGENNLSCRYGDRIAAKAAGAQSTGVLVFVGNIATTTEPGIYTSTLTFIATGIY